MTNPHTDELRAIPLFAGLDAGQLTVVASVLRPESYPPGRTIVREGDIGYDFFVIREGNADVTSETQVLRRLGPGDFFGEIGIASSDGKRTATVTARTDVEVWTMFGTSVQQLQSEHPEVAATLHAVMQQRIAGQ